MSLLNGLIENHSMPRSSADAIMTEHRSRVQREEEERAQKRQLDLAALRSNDKSPDMRIRAWEKVHGLRLPPSPTHPILVVIAYETGLTVAEIQQEQSSRQEHPATVPGLT